MNLHLPTLVGAVIVLGGALACSGPGEELPADGDAAAIECTIVPPSDCPSPAPVYADIAPILEERCIGCHDGAGENWSLLTYTHVTAWYAEIRGVMLDCAMPPEDSGIAMPAAERDKILEWIRCGYPEN